METGGSSSVRVFDGTTDFRVWRARVENELMRYQLLGYVLVRGYNGSQTFSFNGEQVPPRYPVIHVDDDVQQSVVKEEAASCGRQGAPATQQGRLSRWDVLGESAEAKSILQRFLHPDVECAILNKNIYDSWEMLCALYGNRSNPGAHDAYEMHRVLHHIRLGDKKGEPVREFITRWEMLMQQYALATGIELTDGFRSVSLAQTLPSAWRSMVTSWRGVRPFVPYPELVEKVIVTRDRMQQEQAEAANSAISTVLKPASGSASDAHSNSLPDKSAASVQPVTRSVDKPAETTAGNAIDKVAEKHVSKHVAEKPAEKRAAEVPKISATATKTVQPPIDVSTEASNTVDLTSEELSSSSETNKARSSRSLDTTKKSPTERSSTPRPSKSPKEKENREKRREETDRYDKREAFGKNSNYESFRGYSKYTPHDRYGKSPRSRYEKKYASYDRFESNKNGPVSCFYCLKVGHHMKQCWYLKADIENGTTHDKHKKYSSTVTIDRNAFMVKCLESYIDEVNRARASYGASSTPRSHRDYEVRESVGRLYSPNHQEFVPPPPPGQPPAYAEQSVSASSAVPDYRKRSHSVFQRAEGRISSRDPRLNRSRSVFRSTDIAEDFSPRKRARAPSFERQLQAYY